MKTFLPSVFESLNTVTAAMTNPTSSPGPPSWLKSVALNALSAIATWYTISATVALSEPEPTCLKKKWSAAICTVHVLRLVLFGLLRRNLLMVVCRNEIKYSKWKCYDGGKQGQWVLETLTHFKLTHFMTLSYSADTRTMNAKALFSLYLYFIITLSITLFSFYLYFIITLSITFFRTSKSQSRGDAMAETFFRLFSTEKRVKRCVGQ